MTKIVGAMGLRLNREELRHPLVQRIFDALREEEVLLVKHLRVPADIGNTTLLRGELRLLERILARAVEVGPESRQSEPPWPESATSARAVAGFSR